MKARRPPATIETFLFSDGPRPLFYQQRALRLGSSPLLNTLVLIGLLILCLAIALALVYAVLYLTVAPRRLYIQSNLERAGASGACPVGHARPLTHSGG